MLSGLLSGIKDFFFIDSKRVLSEYKDEFIDEIVFLNWRRANIIQAILLVCDLALIAIDKFYYQNRWESMPAYRNLYYAHILLLAVIILYAILSFSLATCTRNAKHFKTLYLSITAFSLFWCEALAINAQLIHGQISAYIVSAFCIASIMLINPMESTIIYLVSYISFIIGLIKVQQDPVSLSGNIINSGFLIVLSIIISKLLYSSFISEFLNKKLIEENASRLNEINDNLERMVEVRSCELIQANEVIVSELKAKHEMERELIEFKELDKLRTAFFSNISHELKTPLNLILSSQQLLELKLKNLMPADSFTQVSKQIFLIRQNSYRMIRLVSNLLDIAKIDSGYFELSLRNHDIVKVVEDIVMSIAEYTKSKNIELVFDTDIEERVIACDADKIERVILNLLSNAVKFTESGGGIFVSISSGDGKISISVKDTGVGIPKGLHKSIFERFVQADNSLTKKSEGTGIGLSLVKSIVELHRGSITLNSELGKGSEFIVELPDKPLISEEDAFIKDDINNNRLQMINIEFSDIYT